MARPRGVKPFSFYSSLLSEDGGRRAMEARLGLEAGDAFDEFLRLALAHEAEAAPSLAAFLDDIEALQCSIKRDMETGVDVVRVMTVHAAKGLEAKIVFLPDTCGAPSPRHEPNIFALDSGSAAAPGSPGHRERTQIARRSRRRARRCGRPLWTNIGGCSMSL